MIKATIIGRVGQDPKQLKGGAGFSVASSVYGGKDKGEVTTWVDVAIWDEQRAGFVMNHIKKGALVVVTGDIGTRSYDSNGTTKTVVTCRAATVDFGPSNKKDGQSDGTQRNTAPSNSTASDGPYQDAEIPF